MFVRKYARMADAFPEVVMLEIYGDETPDTRRFMVEMKIKSTPTFVFSRGAAELGAATGVNDRKILRAVVDRLTPDEAADHADAIEALRAEAEAVSTHDDDGH